MVSAQLSDNPSITYRGFYYLRMIKKADLSGYEKVGNAASYGNIGSGHNISFDIDNLKIIGCGAYTKYVSILAFPTWAEVCLPYALP